MRSMQKRVLFSKRKGEVKMKVHDIILSAASLIGCYEQVKDYIDEEGDDGATVTELLLRCFNFVENELALDYLPLVAEEEKVTNAGKLVYSGLKNSIVRIINVMDEAGNSIAYQVFPDYLMTQEGKVRIVYSYTPTPKTIGDESDFTLYVSTRMYEYGILAEYFAAVGRFEEARVWDEKYKDAIEAAYRAQSGGKMPARRWV